MTSDPRSYGFDVVQVIAQPHEIPDWVPSTVKSMALAFPFLKTQDGDPIGRRLLLNNEMKSVWDELKKHAVDKLEYEDDSEKLDTWEIDDRHVSLQDRAYAAFYIRIVTRFCLGFPARTQADADLLAKPWLDAAELCRREQRNGLFPRGYPAGSGELEKALTIVEKHFEYQGRMRKGEIGNNIYIVNRSGKLRTDDNIRVGCRLIGRITQSIFGMSLVGTVTKIAEIIYQTELNPRNVRNWVEEVIGK